MIRWQCREGRSVSDLACQCRRIVVALPADMQDRQPGTAEGGIHKSIPRLAVRLIVGSVVKLHNKTRPNVSGITKHKVNALLGNAAEVGLPVMRSLPQTYKIRQPHLWEDVPASGGNDPQHVEELALGLCKKIAPPGVGQIGACGAVRRLLRRRCNGWSRGRITTEVRTSSDHEVADDYQDEAYDEPCSQVSEQGSDLIW